MPLPRVRWLLPLPTRRRLGTRPQIVGWRPRSFAARAPAPCVCGLANHQRSAAHKVMLNFLRKWFVTPYTACCWRGPDGPGVRCAARWTPCGDRRLSEKPVCSRAYAGAWVSSSNEYAGSWPVLIRPESAADPACMRPYYARSTRCMLWRIRPRGGQSGHFQDRQDTDWPRLRARAPSRLRVSRFRRHPATGVHRPGCVRPATIPRGPVRAHPVACRQ